MKRRNQSLPIDKGFIRGKNTKKEINTSATDLQIFQQYFFNHIGTIYEFEKATGISRADGCRHKRTLEKLGKLQIVKIGKCPISGEKGVQKVTTNPKWFKVNAQLNLFDQ